MPPPGPQVYQVPPRAFGRPSPPAADPPARSASRVERHCWRLRHHRQAAHPRAPFRRRAGVAGGARRSRPSGDTRAARGDSGAALRPPLRGPFGGQGIPGLLTLFAAPEGPQALRLPLGDQRRRPSRRREHRVGRCRHAVPAPGGALLPLSRSDPRPPGHPRPGVAGRRGTVPGARSSDPPGGDPHCQPKDRRRGARRPKPSGQSHFAASCQGWRQVCTPSPHTKAGASRPRHLVSEVIEWRSSWTRTRRGGAALGGCAGVAGVGPSAGMLPRRPRARRWRRVPAQGGGGFLERRGTGGRPRVPRSAAATVEGTRGLLTRPRA